MSFIQHTRQQLSLTDNHLKTQPGNSWQTQLNEMSFNIQQHFISYLHTKEKLLKL